MCGIMAVKESDYVILKKDSSMKVIQLISRRPLTLWKLKFSLDGIIGHSFGSSFSVQNGQLVKVSLAEINCDFLDKDDEPANTVTKDNRNLVGSSENQQLSSDQIKNLRKQGATGEEIVEQLVEKSSTFAAKNEFSQKKYIKKKLKKHATVLTVLRPTARNIIEMYYNRGPAKICNLRMDSLSQILTQVNVQAGSRIMAVDICHGVVVGSILERMNGSGCVVHLYSGSSPSRPAVDDGFHFSENVLRCLYSFPLDQVRTLRRTPGSTQSQISVDSSVTTVDVSSILSPSSVCTTITVPTDVEDKQVTSPDVKADVDDEQKTSNVNNTAASTGENTNTPINTNSRRQRGEKRTRRYENPEDREKQRALRQLQMDHAKKIIEDGGMDGLVVAGRLFPTPIVTTLLDFIKPSRPLVIFCPFKEPLVDCFLTLRESGRVVMMTLSETWLRGYQVLPERSHPVIKMSGSGGFLLTATVVGT